MSQPNSHVPPAQEVAHEKNLDHEDVAEERHGLVCFRNAQRGTRAMVLHADVERGHVECGGCGELLQLGEAGCGRVTQLDAVQPPS